MNKIQNNSGGTLLAAILVVMGVVLAGMLMRIHPLGFVAVLLLALIIGSIFYFFKIKRQVAHDKTTGGRIAQRLKNCEEELQQHYQEIKEINQEMGELRESLLTTKHLNKTTQQETKKLLADFQVELDLRQSKVEFYETCQTKLITLLNNQDMTNQLEQKRKKLNRLRERHYDDLAQMEGMKSEMEDDQFYLDSIDRLSLRMLKSDSVNSAESLQLELKEITKELRQL